MKQIEFLRNTVAPAARVYDVPTIRSLRDMTEQSASRFSDNVAFTWLDASKNVVVRTYSEAYSDIKAFSTYLNSKGYKGERIAVFGRNCYEWAATYLAVVCGTGVIVPIDKELKAPDVANILKVSGARAVVCTPDECDTIDEVQRLLEAPIDVINSSLIRDYIAQGRAMIDAGDRSFDEYKVDPYAMSVLLFTSGTTGMAKGVMLSQNNICADVTAMRKRFYVDTNDRVFSMLPLHHTYECTAGFLTPFSAGCSISYCESLRRIMTDLSIFRPTILIVVPLIVENFHANILKKIKKQNFGDIKLNVGRALAAVSPALGRAAFKAVADAFGGRVRLMITGAAALDPNIFRDFEDFGFKMYNGYGLTETAPVCLMHNDFRARSPLTVGYPIAGVDVRLVAYTGENDGRDVADGEVGEIAVRGENVMIGYYQNQGETARVLRDGWFYTGDLAVKDSTGAVKIVGRIKNMIVTKNGKKIFPEEMEYLLEKSPFIKESVVYGSENEDKDGDVTVSAKIFPDYDVVNKYISERGLCSEEQISAFGNDYIEQLRVLFKGIVKELNRGVPGYKMIHMFRIRRTEFVKTTTKKIKRNAEDCDSDYLM
ncbi:MAG: AMP-binding protein [Eubacteriales bacterium]